MEYALPNTHQMSANANFAEKNPLLIYLLSFVALFIITLLIISYINVNQQITPLYQQAYEKGYQEGQRTDPSQLR